MPLAAGSAYLGPWINHRNGYVRGATLTLTSEDTTTLISALVVLIGWTAIACWELICFILHLFRTTSRAKDGLYHQQQVLLRSQSPAFFSIVRLSGLAVAWRSNTRRPFLRSLPIIFLGLFHLAFFTAGAVFVSRITNSSTEVLARGHCGFLKGALQEGLWEGGNATERLIGNVLYQAGYTSYREESSYARSCYGTQLDRSVSSCTIYNKPIIPSVRIDDVPCPFAEKACLDKAISFDTGLVSSEILGINARASDRIQLRKKMTCAPIAIEDYTTGWTTEQKPSILDEYTYLPPNDSYKYFNLGSQLRNDKAAVDYTWAITNSSINSQTQPYRLSHTTYFPGSLSNSNFIPITDFDQKDADLTIIILSNVVPYTDPVEDIWFKATKTGDPAKGQEGFFVSDTSITAMGCVEQYQFCNGEDRCDSMGGMANLFSGVAPDIGYNKLQTATWDQVKNYISFMQVNRILQFLSKEILLASETNYGGVLLSGGLQPDQWKTEMANLFNVSLAGLQAHGVLHAAPGNSEFKPGVMLHDYIIPETTPEHLKLCANQKFRSADYSSVSLFGLVFVIVVCCTIGGLNVVVPRLVKLLQGKWNGKGAAAKRAWIEDDVLQLQRITLEARGLGPWKGRVGAVPVLDSHGAEFQMGNYEEVYAERVPLQEGHVIHDGHIPSQPQWDTKGDTQYSQRPI